MKKEMVQTMVNNNDGYGLVKATHESENFGSGEYGDIVVKFSDIKETIITGENRKYIAKNNSENSAICIEGAIELLTLVKAKESLLGEKYWVFKNAFGQYILAEQTEREVSDFVTKTSDIEEINSIVFKVERELQELVGEEGTLGALNDRINIILGRDGVHSNIEEVDGNSYFEEEMESWSYYKIEANPSRDEQSFEVYFEKIGKIEDNANDTIVKITEIDYWYNDGEEIQ